MELQKLGSFSVRISSQAAKDLETKRYYKMGDLWR
jgi:hypothetical protein